MKDLDFKLYEFDNKFQGPCPVHGGNNFTAFAVYKTGETKIGHWECRTHHCHCEFITTPIGLIRGILSNRECEWRSPGDKQYPFKDTIKYLIKTTNWSNKLHPKLLEQIKKETTEREKKEVPNLSVQRNRVQSFLTIPSNYYIKQGYSPEVLDKYDVGDCLNKSSELYNRAVVPLYDSQHKIAQNFMGRRIDDSLYIPKWKPSKDINPKKWLFNSWHWDKPRKIILVESIGNVLRLEQAGIKNSGGLFGNNISKEQIEIIEKFKPEEVILLMDNDEGGRIGNMLIPKHLRNFRVSVAKPDWGDYNDIGQMPVDEINKRVKEQLCL